MRILLGLFPIVLLAQAPKAAPPEPSPAAASKPADPALNNDDEKTIYSLGLYMYRSLASFDLSPAELKLFEKGLSDAAAGKPATDVNVWGPKFNALSQARTARVAQEEKGKSAAYLKMAAAAPGAVTTPSGLVYRELRPGAGPSPAATDKVKVNYRGTLTNGTEFDSSYARHEPAEFPLNGVIACWTEGLQKMKVGGKSVLVCPSSIAYGDHGQPPIPPGAALTFEVELLEIVAPAAK